MHVREFYLENIMSKFSSGSRRRITFLTCLWFCFSLSNQVMAWNAEGHMVVAQIAYNHLDPAVKAKCDALIAVPLTYGNDSNSNFVTSACWADDHKADLGTGGLHFINLPFSLDTATTNNFVMPSPEIVQGIRSAITTMQNPAALQTDQAASLRYLIHFVGDIQQPLHCTTAISTNALNGDAGGNGFPVGNGWGNLHSLWDSGGGFISDTIFRPLTGTGQSILNSKVAAVELAHPFTNNVGVIPDPMNWAYEGLLLSKTVAYVGITRNSTPTANYLNTTQATASERLAQGGQRLANLLNTIYSSNPFNLTLLPRPNGSVRFSWNAIPGRTYRVQWKQQLDGSAWNDLSDVIAATNSVSFTNALGASPKFYRVKALVN
jgi:S1/P1 Nuclease